MPLNPGQILNDRYRIVRLLAKGGFGAIYRAWDLQRQAPCAVKENLDASAAAQKQFVREAGMLFNLVHPNLPKVHDAFSLPGQGQYLVMDFVEGEDLRNMLIQRNEPFGEAQVMPWLLQVCDALTYLHIQTPPVIHRDLKPANIRITPQGQAIVVDFGIAKIYDPEQRTTLGARAVTPGYSPPEQYGLEITDARSDVYALGATIYHLLTGSEPPPSINLMLGQEPAPPPLLEVNPQVSRHVSDAVQRAMALNPEQRFRSVAEFKAAIQNLVKVTVQPTAAATVRAETAGQPVVRKLTGRGWAAIAAGFVLLTVLIAVILGSRGSAGERGGEATFTPTRRAPLVTETLPGTTIPRSTIPSPSHTPLPPTQTATSPPSATEASLAPSPTMEIAASPTALGGATVIDQWNLVGFEQWKIGCPLPGSPCWTGITSRVAGDSTPLALNLTSLENLLIKVEWEKPSLVFYHRYVTRADSYGVVSILIGSAQIFLKQYTGSNAAGCYDALDLSEQRSRLVKIYFFAKAIDINLSKPYSVDWTIQEVRIYPAFEREMLPGVTWCR